MNRASNAKTLADVIERMKVAEAIVLPQFTPQQIIHSAKQMQVYGDRFVSSIGRAIEYADYANQVRVVAAFPELVKRYRDWDCAAQPH
jgi:hypothetical protein